VYLDDSIRSSADVQQYLDLPLLGIVPRYRLAPGGSSSPAAEPETEVTNPVAPPTTAAGAKAAQEG
jgi:hypothetical protein